MSSEVPSEKLADLKLDNGVAAVPADDKNGDNNATPIPPEQTSKTENASPAPTTEATPPPITGDPPKTPECAGPSPASFKAVFKAFSKFGDIKSDGKHMTLSQSDKWMKQAKVIDGKKITTTDTGIHFKKLKSMKVTFDEYQKFLEDLAKTKKIEVNEIKSKLANCGQPGLHGVSSGRTAAAVERLTDVTKYTGSHKQRFDQSGKGKGMAGRKDISDNSGYVSGYNNKNTYDKTH